MKYYKYAKERFKIYKKLKKYVISYGNYFDSYNKCKMTLNELSKKIKRCPKQTRAIVKQYLELVETEKDNINSFLTHGNVGNENQNHYDKDRKLEFYGEFKKYLEESTIDDTIVPAPWLDFYDWLDAKWECMPSVTTAWRWLSEHSLSYKAWIRTKRKWNRKLEGKQIKEDDLIAKLNKLALEIKKVKEPKPIKPFGMVWETDGCTHQWSPTHLYKHTIVGLIDYSGYMISAHSEPTETNNSYIKVFSEAFKKEGTPLLIKSDRRTGFCYDGLYETDLSKSLNDLGITMWCESHGQHKPMIEGSWNAVQNRLPRFLIANNIHTDEEFDEFVNSGKFVKWFNETFHRNPNSVENVCTKYPDATIDNMFIKSKNTKVYPGNLIKYHNQYFYPVNEGNERIILSTEKGSIVKIEVNLQNNQAKLKYRNEKYKLVKADPDLDAIDTDQVKNALENDTDMLILELQRQTNKMSSDINKLTRLIIESGNKELISKLP